MENLKFLDIFHYFNNFAQFKKSFEILSSLIYLKQFKLEVENSVIKQFDICTLF